MFRMVLLALVAISATAHIPAPALPGLQKLIRFDFR